MADIRDALHNIRLYLDSLTPNLNNATDVSDVLSMLTRNPISKTAGMTYGYTPGDILTNHVPKMIPMAPQVPQVSPPAPQPGMPSPPISGPQNTPMPQPPAPPISGPQDHEAGLAFQPQPTQPMPPVQGLDLPMAPSVPMPPRPTAQAQAASVPLPGASAPLPQPRPAGATGGDMPWWQRNAAMMRDPLTGDFIDPQAAAKANITGPDLVQKFMNYLHKETS